MTRARFAGFAALSGLVLLFASFSFARVGAPVDVQRWEYKVIRDTPNVREFNELGQEGWELCGAGSPTCFVFKRPKS
jgi:hypothetical protein